MRYVTYLRVSTKQQGDSGLGIEGQRAAIKRWLHDDQAQVTEFLEIESGKKNKRPQLDAAIAYSKKIDCKLVIAKLDRLSRNVLFIATLMEAGVDFVCVDNPSATPLTLHIFAAIAEQELRSISERTKAALAAKKAQGFKLGKPDNLKTVHREQGVVSIKRNAATNKANVQARNLIRLLSQQQLSLTQIADHLNQHDYQTRNGRLFTKENVYRLRKTDPAKSPQITE